MPNFWRTIRSWIRKVQWFPLSRHVVFWPKILLIRTQTACYTKSKYSPTHRLDIMKPSSKGYSTRNHPFPRETFDSNTESGEIWYKLSALFWGKYPSAINFWNNVKTLNIQILNWYRYSAKLKCHKIISISNILANPWSGSLFKVYLGMLL